MKDSVCGLHCGIGGTMLFQKPNELVSNGVIVRRLLNVGETALYLGVKVDTVYKWSRMGVLSKVKLGGALRFDVNVLDRFIEQHSTKTIDY
jgi:excisionase family DNA binding protein